MSDMLQLVVTLKKLSHEMNIDPLLISDDKLKHIGHCSLDHLRIHTSSMTIIPITAGATPNANIQTLSRLNEKLKSLIPASLPRSAFTCG